MEIENILVLITYVCLLGVFGAISYTRYKSHKDYINRKRK